MTRDELSALLATATAQLAESVDASVARAIGRRHVITPADAQQRERRAPGGGGGDADTDGARYFSHAIHRRSARVSGAFFADTTCRLRGQFLPPAGGVAVTVGTEGSRDVRQYAAAVRVYMYEAHAAHLAELHTRIAAAGMRDTTIVRQVAVSNYTGVMHHRSDGRVTVTRAVTLSEEIKEHVHVATISASGHEWEVLDGMTDLVIDYGVDVIHLTLSPAAAAARPGSLDATLQWLHDAGYLCFRCRDAGLELAFTAAAWTWQEFAAAAAHTTAPQLLCM